MDPDQIASDEGSSLIWIHVVCNIGCLRTDPDERTGDKSRD